MSIVHSIYGKITFVKYSLEIDRCLQIHVIDILTLTNFHCKQATP